MLFRSVVTLTGGVWPDWVAGGTLTPEGTTFVIEVASRDSDTQLTLTNLSFQVAPASNYTLNVEGTPARFLTVFMTMVSE